jgi:hypothetical protein
MPLNSKHKLFFIHIPKTAGSTIETALNMKSLQGLYCEDRLQGILNVNPQHLKFKDLNSIINFKNLTTFTVVRNPFDRIVSEYKYIKSIEGYLPEYRNLKFDDFVNSILLDQNKYRFDNHFESQYSFIEGGEEYIKIFKYENIKELFDWLSDFMQRPLSFNNEKKSNKMHYSFYFQRKDTIDLVHNFYKDDFEKFNYCFENRI